MNIGVMFVGYNVMEHMDSVINPWIYRKSIDVDNNYFLSCANGIFSEFYELFKQGKAENVEDGSREKLKVLFSEKKIDHLYIPNEENGEILTEQQIRTKSLEFLKNKKCELIWIVELQDEVYTQEQIDIILRLIKKYNNYSQYKINFKNYVFDKSHYIDDFISTRIFWDKDSVHGGINYFNWSADVIFNDGTMSINSSSMTIPKKAAFVTHYSWVGSKEYLISKINYRLLHDKVCSYKWNDEKDCLEFDDSFFQRYGLTKPIVYED